MLDYEADILAGIDRFSDSSSDSEHGHYNLVDGNNIDNDSNTNPFFYTRQSQNVNSGTQQHTNNLARDELDVHFDGPQTSKESDELDSGDVRDQVGSGFTQQNAPMQKSKTKSRKGKERATSSQDYLTDSEDELYEESFNLQFRKRILDDNEDYIEKRSRQRSNTYSSTETGIHHEAQSMNREINVDSTPAPHSFNFGAPAPYLSNFEGRPRGRPRKLPPVEPQNTPKRKPGRPRKDSTVTAQQLNNLNNYFSGRKEKVNSRVGTSSNSPKSSKK
ncbi:hypothetical protein G6F43_013116 [Rhizopus delemar]|nr:hypothetical protein G6F43_013116 [Rhizopus delemar]